MTLRTRHDNQLFLPLAAAAPMLPTLPLCFLTPPAHGPLSLSLPLARPAPTLVFVTVPIPAPPSIFLPIVDGGVPRFSMSSPGLSAIAPCAGLLVFDEIVLVLDEKVLVDIVVDEVEQLTARRSFCCCCREMPIGDRLDVRRVLSRRRCTSSSDSSVIEMPSGWALATPSWRWISILSVSLSVVQCFSVETAFVPARSCAS